MKLSKSEKAWVLYDVGNSAFTLLITAIVPLYFYDLASQAGLSDVQYLAYWGYAASISTLIVSLIGPMFGTMSDYRGWKKPFFLVSAALAIGSCLILGLPKSWLLFLILFILGKSSYAASLVFYDAMLPDVTTPDRVDLVSSQGYGWGYLGSVLPFALCLFLVFRSRSLGLTTQGGMILSFSVVALWWGLCTLPLLHHYRQLYYLDHQSHPIRTSFSRLWHTLKNARKNKAVLLFLAAYFFYIDGVYTIIDMASAYGSALGLSQSSLLLALLVTQLVAFPFAILFGFLSQQVRNSKLITVCIGAYLGITVFAVFLQATWQFWVLAVLVGMFQGGIQALSRSYFTTLVPPEQAGEYFGLMDVCSKGAAFVGTLLVSSVIQLTDSLNLGVAAIPVLLILGLIFFRKADQLNP